MIRFDAGVEIKEFFWAIIPSLLNASEWSNRHKVPLTITAILGREDTVHADPYIQGRIDFRVDSKHPPDTKHLAGYFTQCLPAEFTLAVKGRTVIVFWSCRQPVKRAAYGKD